MTLSRPLRINWLIVGIDAFQRDRRQKCRRRQENQSLVFCGRIVPGPKRRCIILTKSLLSSVPIWLQGRISGILSAHARQDPFQKGRRRPQARGEEVHQLTQERRERLQGQVARSAWGQTSARSREGAERSHCRVGPHRWSREAARRGEGGRVEVG